MMKRHSNHMDQADFGHNTYFVSLYHSPKTLRTAIMMRMGAPVQSIQLPISSIAARRIQYSSCDEYDDAKT